MPTVKDYSATTQADEVVVGSMTFLLRIAERFGVPTLLCILLMYWVRSDLLKPLLDAHYTFIGQIVRGQETHTLELKEVGNKLDTMIMLWTPLPTVPPQPKKPGG